MSKKDADLNAAVLAFLQGWGAAHTIEDRQRQRKDIVVLMLRMADASETLCNRVKHDADFGSKETMDDLTQDLVDDASSRMDQRKAGNITDYSVLQPAFGGQKSNEQKRERFAEFFRVLLSTATVDQLAGQDGLAEYIVDVALPLSACTYAPLRHVATLVCIHLFVGLLERSKSLNAQGAVAEAEAAKFRGIHATLLQKEQGKSGNSTVTAKVLKTAEEDFKGKDAECAILRAQAAGLAESAADIINAHIPHRYKDTVEGVRVDTLQALGAIMLAHPDTYLVNGYLKFLGWMLNDRHEGIRKASLSVLQSLYTLDMSHIQRTNEFMTRFKGRIAEMTRDVKESVACEAVRLLHLALQAEQLTQEELDQVREAVLSEYCTVRTAAAALLLDFLPAFEAVPDTGVDVDVDADAVPSASGKGGKKGGHGGAGVGAGGKTVAKAATAAAEKVKKARDQLFSLVDTAATLLPTDSGPHPELSIPRVATALVSAFWSVPAGSVLSNWDAHVLLLLGPSAVAGLKTGAGDAAGPELTELHTKIALRMLFECVVRAGGVFETDEPAVVHVGSAPTQQTGPAGGAPAESATHGSHVSSTAAAMEASAASMSSAIAPMLPDLLGSFGMDMTHAALLACLVPYVRPSVYGSQAGAKLASSTVHQLLRMFQSHSSEDTLESLASALLHLCGPDQPKAGEAKVSVSKVVTTLTASILRLIGKLTKTGGDAGSSSKAGGKGKGKGKKGGVTAGGEDDMEVEQQQAEQEAESSGLATYTAKQMLRLRVLVQTLCSGEADLTFPEVDLLSSSCPLSTPLDNLLSDRMQLAALFEDANAAVAAQQEDANSKLDCLCSSSFTEGVKLYSSLFGLAALGTANRAAAAFGGTEEEKTEAALMATNAARLRDKLIAHLYAGLRARHPEMIAAYFEQQGQAVDPEIVDNQVVVATTYGLAGDAAEQAYILRTRLAAYQCLVSVCTSCSMDSLGSSLLAPLAYSPSELDCALIGLYVNNSLEMTAEGLELAGLSIPNVANAGIVADESGAYVPDEDATLEELLAHFTDELKLDTKQIVRTKTVVQQKAVTSITKATHIQRVEAFLEPLVKLALACASNDKIGSSVVRRLADELNEAGPAGILFSKAYAEKLKEVDKWKSLLSSQLRSISDGAKYISRMVLQAKTLTEQAGGAVESDLEVQAQLAALQSTLQAGVEQLTSVVKRQVQALGKLAKQEVLVIMAKLLVKFAADSVEYSEAWPWRSVLLVFLIPYLTAVPPSKTKGIFSLMVTQLTSMLEGQVPAGGSEADDAYEAAKIYWAMIQQRENSKEADAATSISLGGGKYVTVQSARPWIPAAALLYFLQQGNTTPKAVESTMTRALRVYTGVRDMKVQAAVAEAGAGQGENLAASRAGGASRKGAAASDATPAPVDRRGSTSSRRGSAASSKAAAKQESQANAVSQAGDDEEELSLDRKSGTYLSLSGDSSTQSSTGLGSAQGGKTSILASLSRSTQKASQVASQAISLGAASTYRDADEMDEDEGADSSQEEEDDDEEDDEDFGKRRRKGGKAAGKGNMKGAAKVPARKGSAARAALPSQDF